MRKLRDLQKIKLINFQVTYLFSIKKLLLPRYIKEEQR